jgi:hypothetical protein
MKTQMNDLADLIGDGCPICCDGGLQFTDQDEQKRFTRLVCSNLACDYEITTPQYKP